MAKSFENPLIPHARMRALYRGLVETRLLNGQLRRAERLPRGLEACWVATAIDLREGDVSSDSATTQLPAYLRRLGLRGVSGIPGRREIAAFLSAKPVPFSGTAAERLLCAVGAAMAVKARGEGNVAIAYVRPGELAAREWARLLHVSAAGDLPLIVVAAGCEAPRTAVPVIPVDGSDTIAIYRVAQESLLRARAEGGVVVIECAAPLGDCVAKLGEQLTARGIATPAWLARAETALHERLAQ